MSDKPKSRTVTQHPFLFCFFTFIIFCANINYIFVTLIIINIYFNQAVSIVYTNTCTNFLCVFPCQVIYLLIINNVLLLLSYIIRLIHFLSYNHSLYFACNAAPCHGIIMYRYKKSID